MKIEDRSHEIKFDDGLDDEKPDTASNSELIDLLSCKVERGRQELDKQMKEAGMSTIDEMVASLTDNPLLLQAEVVDLATFESWLEMKTREYSKMQAIRQIKKHEDDEMFEWILAHAALFSSVLAHYRKATAN
jgi:hypothetical protein